MEEVNFLAEWTVKFLENKDSVRRSIVKIERKENGFIVNYKENARRFGIMPSLDANFLNGLKENESIGIVTLNNPENIKFVHSNWSKLASFRMLSIYFTNPFSSTDRVWILNPYVHNSICDKSSLLQGLKSMSEMVETINEGSLKEKLRLKRQEAGPGSR